MDNDEYKQLTPERQFWIW